MKAAIKTGTFGTTIEFSNDVSSPSIPKDDKDSVLIQVYAGAINPIDYKLPKAMSRLIVAHDFCGKVTEAHPDSGFEPGDLVFGMCKAGALAEYTLASSKDIAKAPEGWTATELAAITTGHMSSLQCLQKGKIDDDATSSQKSVLVIGASGGCGLAAVQLCAGLGVSRIVAINSAKNDAFVREHGATEVVNYANASELESFFAENKGKFDCVVDTATNSGGGENYWEPSIDLLRRDAQGKVVGEYTALNGPASKLLRWAFGRQKEHETFIAMKINRPDLERVLQLMDRTGARPVTNVMAFDKEGLQEGFKLLKSRRTKGKIVFDIAAASA